MRRTTGGDPIEQELLDAQAEFEAYSNARTRRQNAVIQALEAGRTKYRIGQVLGVAATTVNSIIKTAQKDARD